jgi:hypothetical protein
LDKDKLDLAVAKFVNDKTNALATGLEIERLG